MKSKIGIMIVIVVIVAVGWFGRGIKGAMMRAEQLNVTSSSFKESEPIPIQYTGQGKDISPALQWEPGPISTKSFVLIADDPDAPGGTWVHWLIFNIPPTVTSLPENLSIDIIPGALEGTNSWARVGYGGPQPPAGKAHRYYFKIFALNILLDFNENVTKTDLEKAMADHILAQGYIMGTYQHQETKH
jgi:Raf kinase inhibitor-like YbhB/YbcL family protein